VIESRIGKCGVVSASLILALVLATSRPKRPEVIFPFSAGLVLLAGIIAWRVRVAPSPVAIHPLGDANAFIAAVPQLVARLDEWAQGKGVPAPPRVREELAEWVWAHREPLGDSWRDVFPGLVALHGEALRAGDPLLEWSVRAGEPALRRPGSLWPAKRLFHEVHDAVFADV
jgi:hypothetical protein